MLVILFISKTNINITIIIIIIYIVKNIMNYWTNVWRSGYVIIVLNFCLKHGSPTHIHNTWKPYHLYYVRYACNLFCNRCAYTHCVYLLYVYNIRAVCVCVVEEHSLLQGSSIIDMNKTSVFGRLKILFVVFSGDLPNLTWKHTTISSRNKYRSAIGCSVCVCVCMCVCVLCYRCIDIIVYT